MYSGFRAKYGYCALAAGGLGKAFAFAVDLANCGMAKGRTVSLDAQIAPLVYSAAIAPIGLLKGTSEEQLTMAFVDKTRTPTANKYHARNIRGLL